MPEFYFHSKTCLVLLLRTSGDWNETFFIWILNGIFSYQVSISVLLKRRWVNHNKFVSVWQFYAGYPSVNALCVVFSLHRMTSATTHFNHTDCLLHSHHSAVLSLIVSQLVCITERLQKAHYCYCFRFCLTDLFSRNQSRSGQVRSLKSVWKNPRRLLVRDFSYRLDAHPSPNQPCQSAQ